MFEIESGQKQVALKVVIYGPEGVGKSTLASHFPNPLFIDTEGSTNHMDVNRLKKPSSFSELIQMIKWVKQQKVCSTLIIDTADWAQQLAEQAVLAENDWSSIEAPGYGEGYVKTREKWGDMIDELTEVVNTGINVVLTAHAEIKKFEDPTEMNSYDRYELKLAKRSNAHIAGVTKEWADMVLFINYETYAVKRDGMGNDYTAQGGQRMMYTSHHPAYDAKNRFGLPEKLPLNYEGIAHVVPDLISGQTQVNQTPPDQASINQTQQIAQTYGQNEQPLPDEQTVQTNHQPAVQDPFPTNDTSFEQQKESFEQAFPKEEVFPTALVDLMNANGVSEDEIRAVMGVRGHFPIDTPFENIAQNSPDYFEQGLVANWDGVMQVVRDVRNNPKQLIDLYAKVGDESPETTVENLLIKY